MSKQIRYDRRKFGRTNIELQSDYIDGVIGDTLVIVGDTQICYIGAKDFENFTKELNGVVSKYEI